MYRSLLVVFAVVLGNPIAFAYGRTLEFAFVADDFGHVGSFTIDEADLLSNLGEVFPNQLSNRFINTLDFAFDGTTWTSADIHVTGRTVFETGGTLPQVINGGGVLADRAGEEILIFPSGTIFGDRNGPTVPGTWSTSVIVPEPASIVLGSVICGVLAVGTRTTRP